MSDIAESRGPPTRQRGTRHAQAMRIRDDPGVPRPPQCPTRRVHRGNRLYGVGDGLRALYVVRSGFFKVSAAFVDGNLQVFEFPMTGDVLGLDAIHGSCHRSDAVALDESDVFELSFASYERWLQISPHCQQQFARMLADQIVRNQELMLLRAAPAEQRLATFLLDLSERYRQLGFSRSRFIVRMTRQEMGAYLGLKLETVSRWLSHLQHQGLIQVQGKSFALLDFAALWRLSGRPAQQPRPAAARILNGDGELRATSEA